MSVTEAVAFPVNGAPTPHPKEQRDRAFALYCEGKSFVDIAHETRIPAPTVRAWANRDNWDERRDIVSAAPELSAETQSRLIKVVKQSIPEPSDLDLVEKQQQYETAMGDLALRIAVEAGKLEGEQLFIKAQRLKDLDGIARKALKLERESPTTIVQIALLNDRADKPARISTRTAHEQPIIEV